MVLFIALSWVSERPTPAAFVLMLLRKSANMHDLSIQVMVANEPRCYREALAATLREVRPDVETMVVAPDELDQATVEHEPRLVVCSALTDVVESQSVAWALLYPEGASWSELSLDGKRIRVTHIDLSQLLALIDQAVVHADEASPDFGA
jgi:hypothetical protein